ncbi:MAG: hypothetical protein P9L91_09025 [Candidatus Zophobacter franzmannii]|nr:hypothetical protein [Candidatus Zophobacter franzmannii]
MGIRFVNHEKHERRECQIYAQDRKREIRVLTTEGTESTENDKSELMFKMGKWG